MSDHSAELDRPPTPVPQSLSIHPENIPPLEDQIDAFTQAEQIPISQSQEETRAKIALQFTNTFLLLVGVAFLVPFVIGAISPKTVVNPIESAKELMTILASILAGPFGFIVGFYFKQSNSGD